MHDFFSHTQKTSKLEAKQRSKFKFHREAVSSEFFFPLWDLVSFHPQHLLMLRGVTGAPEQASHSSFAFAQTAYLQSFFYLPARLYI